MTKLEQLKTEMDKEYKKYKELKIKADNQRDMIDGSLNRIAISDNEEEVERQYNALITYSIKEYRKLSRESHKQWVIYDEKFEEYCKEKKQNV